MSVCTTCLKPGLPADGRHDCPGLGDIQLTRQLGRGLRVDTAPARARMAITVLADHGHGHGLSMQGADCINIADQVLYQVVGYDPESAALVLELVEDWRPKRAPDATVCTPIPAATLMQLSEVPPELLTEQQLGRAENALERLRLAREALIRDGYFTADEIGPDIAPRIVEWLSHHHGRVAKAETDLAWQQSVNSDLRVESRARGEKLAEVEDQLRRIRIELEHWQTAIVPGLRAERDKARATLREVLDVFTTARRDDGVIAGHFLEGAIHPDDMTRWRAALDPEPLTDSDGRTICTCTHGTPCGCGTSVHYAPRKGPTS